MRYKRVALKIRQHQRTHVCLPPQSSSRAQTNADGGGWPNAARNGDSTTRKASTPSLSHPSLPSRGTLGIGNLGVVPPDNETRPKLRPRVSKPPMYRHHLWQRFNNARQTHRYIPTAHNTKFALFRSAPSEEVGGLLLLADVRGVLASRRRLQELHPGAPSAADLEQPFLRGSCVLSGRDDASLQVLHRCHVF